MRKMYSNKEILRYRHCIEINGYHFLLNDYRKTLTLEDLVEIFKAKSLSEVHIFPVAKGKIVATLGIVSSTQCLLNGAATDIESFNDYLLN